MCTVWTNWLSHFIVHEHFAHLARSLSLSFAFMLYLSSRKLLCCNPVVVPDVTSYVSNCKRWETVDLHERSPPPGCRAATALFDSALLTNLQTSFVNRTFHEHAYRSSPLFRPRTP